MLRAFLTRNARRLGLGRLAYRLVYLPRAWVARRHREGFVNLALSDFGQWYMRRAARRLPPLRPPAGLGYDIHLLTGARFWEQTAFCIYSLQQQSPAPLRPVIYDDGTLRTRHEASLCRLFPDARIISSKESTERLDRELPAHRFPSLRARRLVYPHLRKLTDIHAGTTGWKLVLDSDMLCFQEPTLLLNWLANPDRPCHMIDCATSYGYPVNRMAELAGGPIAERVNVGVCGLQSDAIDWDRLEHWCRSLECDYGTSYYLEQALTAMLLAGQDCLALPERDYLVKPSRDSALAGSGVLHHFVAESKAWYFRIGWTHVALTSSRLTSVRS